MWFCRNGYNFSVAMIPPPQVELSCEREAILTALVTPLHLQEDVGDHFSEVYYNSIGI